MTEATMIGAGLLAGTAVGTWPDLAAATETVAPARRVEPGAPLDREQWTRALDRAKEWFPDLSALDF
ncbi:MAG: hypothetical protein HKN41_11850 [Ilumatobacter sp.]|nr:hypothetical protein [Ilumatobacter sp.]